MRSIDGSSSAGAIGGLHFLRRLRRRMRREVNSSALLRRRMRRLSGGRRRSDLVGERSGEVVRNDENALRGAALVAVCSLRHLLFEEGRNVERKKEEETVALLWKFGKCGGEMW